MTRIRILFGALVIVNILLVASIIYVIYEPELHPSISKQMALTSEDLGLNWTCVVTPDQYDDVVDYRVSNDTYEAAAWLFVFDNVSECEHMFQNQSGITSIPKPFMTVLNITLGDEAILCYTGTSDQPEVHLMFAKDNIFYSIFAANFVPDSYKEKPWWIDTTIWIAQLQLDKIDQYLAQHPGAS
jgi:hypothetical protein